VNRTVGETDSGEPFLGIAEQLRNGLLDDGNTVNRQALRERAIRLDGGRFAVGQYRNRWRLVPFFE